jgi:hypothetical protein
MWVRMIVFPGGAQIARLEAIPVAVDIQIRRVTENLGLADTLGVALEDARETIQNAWRAKVSVDGAEGPTSLAGTCAGLDPALWYFGRVGCSYCEARGHRVPMASVCSSCRLPEAPPDAHSLGSPSQGAAADGKPLIGLVGCVKTKLPYAAEARSLYVSPLFVARRKAVEGRAAKWFILSAEHGLTRPDQLIEPYDRELAELPVAVRRDWAAKVIGELRRELGELGHYRFEIHAGHAYFGFGLVDGLRAGGAEVAVPTEGLTQGRQRQFYSRGTRPDGPPGTQMIAHGPSPYKAIIKVLDKSEKDDVSLDFDEIEAAVGCTLPPSARTYAAWWFGSPARRPPWIEAGWRPRPRLREGFVQFVRDPAKRTL